MMKYEVAEVISDLYEAGRTEDGQPFIAEIYLVQVESTSGSRAVHTRRFPGCVRELDEEGFEHFLDVREEAKAAANRLATRVAAHLAAGGELDPIHWDYRSAAYGSAAYIAEGCEEDAKGL